MRRQKANYSDRCGRHLRSWAVSRPPAPPIVQDPANKVHRIGFLGVQTAARLREAVRGAAAGFA